MMKRVQLFPIAVVLVIMLLGVFGCSKNQDRYIDPPWLGGSSIETLTERGNYTIFLNLMEKAEYTIPITKQLFTLFVPNDDAFNKYFQDAGISSVESLTKDEARQLFTLHVLPNPRSRFQLIYEYQWNELQGPTGEYASLFFRKYTNSTSIPYIENVKYFTQYKGKDLLMKTGQKLMPLFSKDYFEDYFADVNGSDYLFMYPGSKWESGHGDMNWGNAMVTESEVRTSNGFIYFVDQVVPPQKNIDEYLKANPEKFGLFYDMMQRFATYAPGGMDDQKRLLYVKSYFGISNIAEDKGPTTGTESSMLDMYTAYLPTNEVLQDYLDKNVLNTYEVIDSVPAVTLYYILQTQISRSLGLVSKITKNYFNPFGDPTIINKSDIKSAHMCSNGLVYEMNKVLEPNVFTTVPGTLFFNKNYSTLLFTLNAASLLGTLSNPDVPVSLFASSTKSLFDYGIRYNTVGTPGVEIRGKDKLWKKMIATELDILAKDQIFKGVFPDLSGEGFAEMSSFNFVHYSNGTIQGAENQHLNEFVTIDKTIPNEKNGILFNVSAPIKSKWLIGHMLVNDPEVSQFKDLLVWTTLLDDRATDVTTKDNMPNLKFFAEENYWTAFIPTNAAMDQARAEGYITWPTTKTEFLKLSKDEITAVKNFLTYHFIRKNTIFDDGLKSGDSFNSNRVESISTSGTTVYAKLGISNTKNDLRITDHSGQVISVDHSKANILVRKGVAHKISSILKY
jgi:uncharacterized surface protein with fasciclin (FAS1) repeats